MRVYRIFPAVRISSSFFRALRNVSAMGTTRPPATSASPRPPRKRQGRAGALVLFDRWPDVPPRAGRMWDGCLACQTPPFSCHRHCTQILPARSSSRCAQGGDIIGPAGVARSVAVFIFGIPFAAVCQELEQFKPRREGGGLESFVPLKGSSQSSPLIRGMYFCKGLGGYPSFSWNGMAVWRIEIHDRFTIGRRLTAVRAGENAPFELPVTPMTMHFPVERHTRFTGRSIHMAARFAA